MVVAQSWVPIGSEAEWGSSCWGPSVELTGMFYDLLYWWNGASLVLGLPLATKQGLYCDKSISDRIWNYMCWMPERNLDIKTGLVFLTLVNNSPCYLKLIKKESMKRFILLTIPFVTLCSISTQIARDMKYLNIHRSAANHYTYLVPFQLYMRV